MKTILRAIVVVFAVFAGGAFVAFKGGAFTELAADEPKVMTSSKSYSGLTTFSPGAFVVSNGTANKPNAVSIPGIWDSQFTTTSSPIIMSSSKSGTLVTPLTLTRMVNMGAYSVPINSATTLMPWTLTPKPSTFGTASSWQP